MQKKPRQKRERTGDDGAAPAGLRLHPAAAVEQARLPLGLVPPGPRSLRRRVARVCRAGAAGSCSRRLAASNGQARVQPPICQHHQDGGVAVDLHSPTCMLYRMPLSAYAAQVAYRMLMLHSMQLPAFAVKTARRMLVLYRMQLPAYISSAGLRSQPGFENAGRCYLSTDSCKSWLGHSCVQGPASEPH